MLRSPMISFTQELLLQKCNGSSRCLPRSCTQRCTAAIPLSGQRWGMKGYAQLKPIMLKQSTWVCFANGQDEQEVSKEEDIVGEEDLFGAFGENPLVFVLISTIFNGGLFLVALIAGNFLDLQVFKELVLPRDAVAGLVCTVPLVAMMLAVTEYGDQFSEIRDIKLMLQKTILPVIRKMPIWGPAVIALGAGLGEEAVYRAVLQTCIIDKGATLVSDVVATGAGIAIASLLFGLGHAINSFYFWWATFAGALFGIEYIMFGLPSAAFTHALYDWIALVYLSSRWSNEQLAESVNND